MRNEFSSHHSLSRLVAEHEIVFLANSSRGLNFYMGKHELGSLSYNTDENHPPAVITDLGLKAEMTEVEESLGSDKGCLRYDMKNTSGNRNTW